LTPTLKTSWPSSYAGSSSPTSPNPRTEHVI
jgi:hypothetical protein